MDPGMGEGFKQLRLQVDPTPEHQTSWVEFIGRQVGHTLPESSVGEDEMRVKNYTLYETPNEGYKLYVVDSVSTLDTVRQPGQGAAEGETRRTLYSEEEGKQKYPGVFDRIILGSL